MTTTANENPETPDHPSDEQQKKMSREELAIAGYDMLTAMLVQLAKKPSETTARNYVAFQLVGFDIAPFDRVEFHFMRPGGITPVARAEALAVQVEHERETAMRHIKANAEIAVLLANRIVDGDPIVKVDDEDAQRIYDGFKSTIAVLRQEHAAMEARNAMALALLKTARDALAFGAANPATDEVGDRCESAVKAINEGLASVGVAL